MIRSKKVLELEAKVFEMETRLELLEFHISNLMKSDQVKIDLDAEKWYQESIDI